MIWRTMLTGAKLLVGPCMSDRAKGKDQAKCNPWSSRLGVGPVTQPSKSLLLRKIGVVQHPRKVVTPVKKSVRSSPEGVYMKVNMYAYF
jgi:hypothetical protein